MAGDDRSDSSRMFALIGGIAVLAVIVVLVLLFRDKDNGKNDEGEQTASACKVIPTPGGQSENAVEPPADDEVLSEGDSATALVSTSEGDFEIELDTEQAPITANSFAYLAEEGFYDGLNFHRIAPGFVIQGGDPTGTGSGGPGYTCVEKPPANLQYTKGIVAMAKSGAEPPGASGSQFFIVTGDRVPLGPDYALVGQVTEGLDVVEKIGTFGTPAEQPTRDVTIDSVEIEEG